MLTWGVRAHGVQEHFSGFTLDVDLTRALNPCALLRHPHHGDAVGSLCLGLLHEWRQVSSSFHIRDSTQGLVCRKLTPVRHGCVGMGWALGDTSSNGSPMASLRETRSQRVLRSRLGVTHIWWDCCFLIQGEQDVRLKSVRKTLVPSDPESPPGKQHTAYFVLSQFLCCARDEVQGSAQGRQMLLLSCISSRMTGLYCAGFPVQEKRL